MLRDTTDLDGTTAAPVEEPKVVYDDLLGYNVPVRGHCTPQVSCTPLEATATVTLRSYSRSMMEIEYRSELARRMQRVRLDLIRFDQLQQKRYRLMEPALLRDVLRTIDIDCTASRSVLVRGPHPQD